MLSRKINEKKTDMITDTTTEYKLRAISEGLHRNYVKDSLRMLLSDDDTVPLPQDITHSRIFYANELNMPTDMNRVSAILYARDKILILSHNEKYIYI